MATCLTARREEHKRVWKISNLQPSTRTTFPPSALNSSKQRNWTKLVKLNSCPIGLATQDWADLHLVMGQSHCTGSQLDEFKRLISRTTTPWTRQDKVRCLTEKKAFSMISIRNWKLKHWKEARPVSLWVNEVAVDLHRYWAVSTKQRTNKRQLNYTRRLMTHSLTRAKRMLTRSLTRRRRKSRSILAFHTSLRVKMLSLRLEMPGMQGC